MAGRGFDVVAVDGDAVGREAGSIKVAGVVLLGALSNHLPFAEATWRQAITSTVSPGWLTMNLAALAAGRQLEAA
jgi:Pyruvate/2-oxoacid:ferredoxin oxidoreductase gamma subunit